MLIGRENFHKEIGRLSITEAGQINHLCRNTPVICVILPVVQILDIVGYLFPFLNDVIMNFIHDNIIAYDITEYI